MLFLSEVINEFTCGGADVLKIIRFVKIILDIILIVVPIGLIILVCLDFFKNVISGKDDEIKKNVNLAIKRIIFCAALFLISPIVNIVITLVGTSTETYLECIKLAKKDDIWKYKIVWDYYPYDTTEPYHEDYDIVPGKYLNYVLYHYKKSDGSTGTIKIYQDGTYKNLN